MLFRSLTIIDGASSPPAMNPPNRAIDIMNHEQHTKLPARKSDFYLGSMRTCLDEATQASLPRVRERSLRAAAAWREMYERARTFEARSGRCASSSRLRRSGNFVHPPPWLTTPP